MTAFEVEQPILNSPFEEPAEHWHIEEGSAPKRVADRRRAGRVRAPVEQDPRADRDELAVARRVVLVAHARGVAVDVPEEALLAPVHHLHGAVGVERGAVDRRVLVWLTGWGPATVAVVVSWLHRASEHRP